MAFFHHHNHHSQTCFCSNRCNTPPPSTTVDPILLQSIVSQLLQNPQSASLFDLNPCSSQNPQHRDQNRSKQKQYSILTSLLQRIDVLESSLHRFSFSANTSSLRHVAARTIQIHFRAHLVRRSRALRELKELASIKSALSVLKSSLSLQKRIDFSSISHEVLDLITRIESIESCDKMVRNSKRSIRREISSFSELIDEISPKRIVSVKMVKQVRMPRNDEKSRVSYAGKDRAKSSKHNNVDSKEKRLINELRERVERIQHISKGLIDEDSEDSDDSNSSGAYHRGKSLKQCNVDSDQKRRIGKLRERLQKVQHSSKGLIDEEHSADSDDSNSSGAYHRGKSLKRCNVDSDAKKRIDRLRERLEKVQTVKEDSTDSDDGNVPRAYHGGKFLKQRNVDSDEKRRIGNLRERGEKVQHCSKGLIDDEEEDSADSDVVESDKKRLINNLKERIQKISKGLKDEKDSADYSDGCGRREVRGKHRSNATQVYDIHEDGKVESDIEEDDAESGEGSEFEEELQNGSLESSSLGSEGENEAKVKPSHHLCQDEKLILCAPTPVKMEGRASEMV